jgi:hypothetical protein
VNKDECFREPDVLEAVRAGEWPNRAEPALREHVESCAVCAEVLAVALALQMDAEDASDVRIPTAAHVWWRAGIRARQDAAQTASRPMTIVEGIGAASGVGLAAAAIALGWSMFSSGWQNVVSGPMIAILAGGAATAVVLVPIALYFALSEPKT